MAKRLTGQQISGIINGLCQNHIDACISSEIVGFVRQRNIDGWAAETGSPHTRDNGDAEDVAGLLTLAERVGLKGFAATSFPDANADAGDLDILARDVGLTGFAAAPENAHGI